MTREEAKELLPIIQAFADGKTIQYNCENENPQWIDVQPNERVDFSQHTSRYRIKPAQKYRPFKDVKECWQEMLKHQPFGWVKYNECYFSIVYIDDNHVVLADKDICSILLASAHSCKDITFADGTPFGIREE